MRGIATMTVLTAVLLLGSCARQGYPSGGPKDTAPPAALGCDPPNESRNFTSRQFFIRFDEYVVLRNADANVLVSPPMSTKPEYTTKGKGVLVKLKDTLKPATTYLFQFKEAIADFNEGNLLPSYEYVFSTGSQMDTMMLAGRVVRARDGKPWGEPLAVSAIQQGDSTPTFVTRTDKDGLFALHYIPAGNYRLLAMDDKNGNWMPDTTEAAAWDTTFFAATDSIDSLSTATLCISQPDRQRQRLLNAEFTSPGHIRIITQLPMVSPALTGAPLRSSLGRRGDTLTVWLLDERCDSTMLVLTDNGLADTLRLRYRKPAQKGRKGQQLPETKEALVIPLCDGQKAFYDSLQLAFRNPIASMSDSAVIRVMRLKDSTEANYRLRLDSTGLTATIMATLHSGEEYSAKMDAGLFTDIYGHPNDSLAFRMKPQDYGTLTVSITNHMPMPLVIEVLDGKDTVVRHQTLVTDGKVRFSHLPAGDYRIRAVLDADSNGRWTTGDYTTGRQPEGFLICEKTLQLREKWEIEEQWTVEKKEPRSSTNRRAGGAARHDGPIAPITLPPIKSAD